MEYATKIKSMSKIEIRSLVIKALSRLRKNCDILNGIKILKKIEDKKFVLSLIIGEITPNDEKYNDILKNIIIELCCDKDKEYLTDLLLSEDINDSKKIVIAELLNNLDLNKNSKEIKPHNKSLRKTKEAQDEKFFQDIYKNIESRIDFLDYLSALDKKDSKFIIESLIKDYKGNKLAKILSLVVFIVQDDTTLLKILNTISRINTEDTHRILNHILRGHFSKNIKDAAIKIKDKIKEPKKNIQLGSEFYEAYTTLLDIQGNYMVAFSRINSEKKISVFYTALNINYGIIDCFGFENISEERYTKLLNKVTKGDVIIKIHPSIAKKIIKEGMSKQNIIPYEFLCWKELMSDIEPKEQLEFRIKKKEISEFEYKKFLKSDFLKTWFIKEEDNIPFNKLMKEILNKEFKENIIEDYKKDIFNEIPYFDAIISREIYLLEQSSMDNEGKILYNILKTNKYLDDFKTKIIHKSIYKYFLQNEFDKIRITNNFLGIMRKWQKEF